MAAPERQRGGEQEPGPAAGPGTSLLVVLVRCAEVGVSATRTKAAEFTDRLQVRLRLMETRIDPEYKRWAEQMRAKIADGSIDKELDAQPADVHEFLAQWRQRNDLATR